MGANPRKEEKIFELKENNEKFRLVQVNWIAVCSCPLDGECWEHPRATWKHPLWASLFILEHLLITYTPHIHQCVLISVFFRSPNSNKSLKQINAGILLDELIFVLETAAHSTLAKKQIYRPDAFHWNCYIWSLFHLPDFSVLHLQLSHWSPLWYFRNLPWLSDSEGLVWLIQLNRKNNKHINTIKCFFSSCFSLYLYRVLTPLASKIGRQMSEISYSFIFLTLCFFTLVWLQGGIYCQTKGMWLSTPLPCSEWFNKASNFRDEVKNYCFKCPCSVQAPHCGSTELYTNSII